MTERRAAQTMAGLLGMAADEFTERLNRGEQPDIAEYAARYPELADVIRQVFPALAALHSEPALAEDRPACLGEYRLIREIGRGGMAVVYEAEQQSLRRRVALKVLPFAAVLDPRQLQRFRNEAQSAALLHHTNIVPVFSVGCEQGVHYFAMQYIDGQPLSAVIEELRQLAGRAGEPNLAAQSGPALDHGEAFTGSSVISLGLQPSRRLQASRSELPVTSRPAFFNAVCRLGVEAAEALQHAHINGVIHRDIKPSNLLLDRDGKLWITDFGLALTQADLTLTMPGDLVGTIRYMSPEQASGKGVPLDHRTDIYSLGATLYELLGQEPVFSDSDRHQLLCKVAIEDPPLLRQRNPAVPRELEVIIGKAMAKDPAERYQRAADLAEDFRRFLQNRPILARPPSLVDRLTKWSRRHRTLVMTGCGFLIVAVAGLSVSTLLIARARSEAVRQRDVAGTAQREAEAQRLRAQDNFALARQAVDRMLTRVAGELANVPRMQQAQRALLQDALEFHQRFLQDRGSDPMVRFEAACAAARVGTIQEALGKHGEAEGAYRQAIEMLTKLSVESPSNPGTFHELARSEHALGQLMWKLGRAAEAEAAESRSVEISRTLCARSDVIPEYHKDLAAALAGLGRIRLELSRKGEAAPSLDEALATYRELVKALPEDVDCLAGLARVQKHRGVMLTESRGPALEAFREAVDVQERVVALRGTTADRAALAMYIGCQADVLSGLGRRLEIPQTARELEGRQGLTPDLGRQVQDFPDLPAARASVEENQRNLAALLGDAGKFEESERLLRRGIANFEKLAAEFPEVIEYRYELASFNYMLGWGLRHRWRVAESEQAYQEAARGFRALLTQVPGHAVYTRFLKYAEEELKGLQVSRDAQEMVQLGKASPEGVAQAVARATQADLEHSELQEFARLVYAEYLIIGGEYARATKVLQRLAEAQSDTRDQAAFYKALAWALLRDGRKTEAEAACRKALTAYPVWSTEPSPDADPDHWTVAYFRGLVTAEQFAQRWKDVSLWGRDFSPFPWFYIGQRLEANGGLEEARAAYRKCMELGQVPNRHHTANWAAYRLRVLEGGAASAPH